MGVEYATGEKDVSEDRWIGRRLGAYELQDRLGAGGMGVVYRALDTKLNRTVAVKLLADEHVDADARRRFRREAEASSSLNHPHILTVHDAGELDGRDYLVTEFVDGGTLHDRLRARTLEWRDALELLTGVADGLAAAHDAGILHRDVKPQNILITKSGYAKLADFGLAKLREGVVSEESPTVTDLRTSTGAIVGTPVYMSPEQIAGDRVDARSDIFAFGIVLFEALAGRRPFDGATTIDRLHAMLHRAPHPLPSGVPPPVRAIVEKALEKNPADRYQSMRELVVDLRRAVRQGDETASSTRIVPAPRSRVGWLVAVVAGGAAAVIVMILAPRFARAPTAPTRAEYTPLTNFADAATQPALSPDGRMLTFVRGNNTFFGPGQVYVKLLPDGEPVALTHDDFYKLSPKFSPDGARIAYSTSAVDFSTMDTWIVPVLGGQPRKLLTNAEGMTWIATASGPPRVLFSELTGRGAQMSVLAATESRSEPREVYVPPEGYGMAHRSFLSPDGRWVIAAEMDSRSWLPCRLTPFDRTSTGKPVGPPMSQCTDAGWSPDGRWMYFTAATAGGVHIWRQRFPDGTAEQLTFGVTEEDGVHVAPDGRSFVTSIGTSQSTVWMHDARGDRQITSEGYGFSPSISPDGKKIYYLVRAFGARSWTSGALWVADVQSGLRQRLLPDFPTIQSYTISADGRRVVFVAVDDRGTSPVWIASLDGHLPPRRLGTIDGGAAFFGAPGDVIFVSQTDPPFIYRISENGDGLQKANPTPGLLPFAVSPDGRWVPVMDPAAFGALMVYPVGVGTPVRLCDECSPPQGTDPMPRPMSWTPDGRYVYVKFAMSTYAIPLKPGQTLPQVPANGFRSKEAIAALPGVRLVSDEPIYPGPNPSVYAFTKTTAQRNIYRVPVP